VNLSKKSHGEEDPFPAARFVSVQFRRRHSGHVTEIPNVAANQFLTIQEPPGVKFAGWDGTGMRIAITGNIGERYDLKTSSNVAAPDGEWTPWQTITNTSRTMTVIDPTTNAPQRFYKAMPGK
jgi:hypothetical protein